MKKFLIKILEICTFLSFSFLVINVLYQIISRRFFPQFSVVWTEEMSRLLFVYSIAFGAPLAIEKRGYVNVEIFHHKLNPRVKRIFDILIEIISIILFSITAYKGLVFVKLGMNQHSVTLGHKMGYVYISIVGTCVLISIFSIMYLKDLLVKGSEKKW
ncbi:TRAP transporter small permease [Oceanivirga salmonicida]|uniref:TRAP transporter small permease n=1 Tax=Oceanivirga salmonicida TaxID=1769291 RepID=UPI00082DB4E4|nr:TRAP transporter small permease subunit [Oceanivirga salmonicida]